MTSVPDCLLTAQSQCRENGYADQKVEHEVEGESRKRRTLRLLRALLRLVLRLWLLVGIAHGEPFLTS